ncbi:CotY/CotZ family spore coat protein [Virgibacillus flavescens]|uniref:CotY/CotZ family spore coat protein n=1 Tax=Virgibacillus flavescens TaxID=1611422 RepID=UPI003D32A0DD
MNMPYQNQLFEEYESENGQRSQWKGCCNQHKRHCVKDVLEAIVEAQKKAQNDSHCRSSCKQSIEDLLGERRIMTKNTIPFMLYCGCEPFKGTGVLTYSCHNEKKFKCINTFIFKIKELKNNCAVLELLIFKSDLNRPNDGSNECGKHGRGACGQLDHKRVDDLIKTGICINVDLSCFCAVTCLPAVRL